MRPWRSCDAGNGDDRFRPAAVLGFRSSNLTCQFSGKPAANCLRPIEICQGLARSFPVDSSPADWLTATVRQVTPPKKTAQSRERILPLAGKRATELPPPRDARQAVVWARSRSRPINHRGESQQLLCLGSSRSDVKSAASGFSADSGGKGKTSPSVVGASGAPGTRARPPEKKTFTDACTAADVMISAAG